MFIVIVCYLVCNANNSEICLGFLIEPFSNMIKKVRTKFRERKELLKRNKTHYSPF